jgi:hypothetical protein
MAISSGLSMQWGHVVQPTVYATTATPVTFPRVNKAEIVKVAARVQGAGIQSGVFGPVAAHYIEATQAGEVSMECDVSQRSMGLLLSHLMGSSSSAQQGGSAAYLQTHTLADPVGKFLTCQIGRPLRGGTVVPMTATGCKVTSAEFKCNMGEILTASWEMDALKVDNTTALATASYVSAPVFHSAIMAVKIGAYSSEAAVTGVRGVSIKYDRPMDTEDYTAGASGLKAEPVINDFTQISGTITADWLAKATFEDLALTITAAKSLVVEFVDTTAIASTYYPTIRFTIPGLYFEPAAQGVDGPKELTTDWNWVWRYDGTNMPKIEYMTADTSIL